MTKDNVNSPSHYTQASGLECIDNKPEDFQVRAFCNTKRLSKDK